MGGRNPLNICVRRTAVLILPEDMSKTPPSDPLEHSLARLEKKLVRGWAPSDTQSKHIDTVVAMISQNSKLASRAAQVLHKCAIAAGSVDIWLRGMRGCGVIQHIDRLGLAYFKESVNVFGFGPVRSM